MTVEYIPPLVFHRWETTREGPPQRRRPPEPIEAWIPTQSKIPPGTTPQAVRLIRESQPAAALRLLSTQAYKIGRGPDCQLLFDESVVSRLHGLLYFSPEISCWVYRDPMSRMGTFVSRSDVPGKREEISHQWPIAIVAGHTIELGNAENRLEFLDRVPWEAAGTSGKVRWRSEAARELELSVLDAAGKQGPVLLFGPSGSGKTFLASRIHELSGRKGSYVELNCGRLPRDSNQLQSELLGHVKGAYTGAIGRRDGALFEADKGTLFLDEVESLPPEAQVFLLDVLEGKAPLRPLGADKGVQRPSVRFICSTKVPLNQTTLREDLVNRLVRGHRIIIPSLVERREDIPILIDSILQVIKAEAGVEATVTKEAMQFLMAQDWPGHVRQLKDALYSTTDGHHGAHIEIGVQMFQRYLEGEAIVRGGLPDRFDSTIEPTEPGTTPVPIVRKRPVDLTRDDLEKALHAAGGVMKRAAEMLGCSPTTLRAKRREFGL